jgi:hypothetical protein
MLVLQGVSFLDLNQVYQLSRQLEAEASGCFSLVDVMGWHSTLHL